VAVPAPSEWDASQVAQALFLARAELSVRFVSGLNTPAERLAALLAGDVDLAFVPLDRVLDPGSSARLRVLAISSPARVAQMPAVPSLREAGLDIAVGAWRALALPVRSAHPVREQLGTALRTVMENPRLRAELTDAGLAPSWLGPDESARALLAEYREAGTLFASLGVSVRKEILGLGRG
ncbi:MAG TPA: tripartite tricarboxylate transporter substrate-binding protein, partial [Acetobacteraceae bacterium]|nr:tripartite tricarboxylate transporter substrate-binding protein [Acetobacteraceae bacterium]